MAVELPDNQKDRERYLREHRAGEFVDAVRDVRRQSLGSVMLGIGAFVGEPETLYVALDCASNSSVTVTMTPLQTRDPSNV